MKIRIGVDCGRVSILSRAQSLGAPLLVSANSLWNDKRKQFSGWDCYTRFDTALDSGGFVAMKRYGGYRWAIHQYVELARDMRPTWWAQMDFCCEPEIASDRSTVFKRIDCTAEHLHECQSHAHLHGVAPPLPVLQGWHPSDYTQGPIYSPGYQWPDLVGIGSVCRRKVHGTDGIVAVVNALHQKVPDHVRFHLFGVKSQALTKLLDLFPTRIASIDSMAWNMAARWEALHANQPCDAALKADCMERWYIRQFELLARESAQLKLL